MLINRIVEKMHNLISSTYIFACHTGRRIMSNHFQKKLDPLFERGHRRLRLQIFKTADDAKFF